MKAQARKQAEWQLIIKDFTGSGQEASEYCMQRQLHLRTFKYWYYKLRSGPGSTNLEGGFVGFKLLQPPVIKDNVAVKIILPNGINVEVATDDVINLIKGLTGAF
jgi:hypothetical protein